jgi:hypothetical protein
VAAKNKTILNMKQNKQRTVITVSKRNTKPFDYQCFDLAGERKEMSS